MFITPVKTFGKTRLAPTPSGFLHLGNLYSFAITAALAYRHGAQIMLRIDDMDRDRAEAKYIRDIFDTLNFLGIGWDEGPRDEDEFEAIFSQRHRLGLYEQALVHLAQTGKVFACSCSRADVLRQNPGGIYPGTCRHKNIPLDAANVCWRLDTSAAGKIEVNTLSGTIVSDFPQLMTDFVVRKKDGFPAYQLTSIVDDINYGVDLIVRGQDLWESSLAQLYLSSLLGYKSFAACAFYHHSLITANDGSKLSKSAGSSSIQFLRNEGKTAADIYNILANMAGVPAGVTNWQELISLIN